MTNGGSIFTIDKDVSLTDKLLGRDTINKIKSIMDKEDLDYTDISSLLYLITTDETKLLNLTPYERYVLGKFYTWIREFVKLLEEIYYLKKKYFNTFTEEEKETIEEIRKIMIHNTKFLIDVFLFLSRSTLSIYAKAFEEFLKQKFEYEYKQPELMKPHEEKREFKFIGLRR